MARLVVIALAATGGWLAAIALFAAYANWFSETDRGGDWAVLGLAWLSFMAALAATFAFGAAAVVALVDRSRRHA